MALGAGVFVFYKCGQSGGGVSGEKELVIGDVVEEFNGVKIYYNGPVGNSVGRRRAPDGYNFGMGFQCVEFVKRYYYEKLNHRMPNTWGHARDFFDPKVANGEMNSARGLIQYRNGEGERPKVEDLMVFGPTLFNSYGHVAIVSRVAEDYLEIVQQNPGPRGSSRMILPIGSESDRLKVASDRVLGWLRMP